MYDSAEIGGGGGIATPIAFRIMALRNGKNSLSGIRTEAKRIGTEICHYCHYHTVRASCSAHHVNADSSCHGYVTYRAMEYTPKKQSSNRAWWIAAAAASVGLFFLWSSFSSPQPALVTKAVVVLKGDSKATGTVTFEQLDNGVTTVTGELRNLDPLASRGFHIHQSGDVTGGCLSTGPHFNPHAKQHGAPTDKERHVGDLGNIKTDDVGSASFKFQDSLISLNGPLSIVGRAVVLHAGTDDLGRGGDPESLKTGNAGARAACGVIGLA